MEALIVRPDYIKLINQSMREKGIHPIRLPKTRSGQAIRTIDRKYEEFKPILLREALTRTGSVSMSYFQEVNKFTLVKSILGQKSLTFINYNINPKFMDVIHQIFEYHKREY